MIGSYNFYILDVVNVNIIIVFIPLISALILGLVWGGLLGWLGRRFLDSGDMSPGVKINLNFIILALGLGFSLFEPLDKRLGLFMDLSSSFLGNILLGNLLSPLKENLFFNDILFVERFQNVRNFVHQDRLMNFNGLLEATKKILLGLLIFMRESKDQIAILFNLLLLEHLVIEK